MRMKSPFYFGEDELSSSNERNPKLMQNDYIARAQRTNRGSTRPLSLVLTLLDTCNSLNSQLPRKHLTWTSTFFWIEEDNAIRQDKIIRRKVQRHGTFIMYNELSIILWNSSWATSSLNLFIWLFYVDVQLDVIGCHHNKLCRWFHEYNKLLKGFC